MLHRKTTVQDLEEQIKKVQKVEQQIESIQKRLELALIAVNMYPNNKTYERRRVSLIEQLGIQAEVLRRARLEEKILTVELQHRC
jgi:5,10-methylene-tetrahydrofolate dehydrogenase/methenyl tetrahydrofolate cyclohydrolase